MEGMRLEPGTMKSEVTKRPRLQEPQQRCARQGVQKQGDSRGHAGAVSAQQMTASAAVRVTGRPKGQGLSAAASGWLAGWQAGASPNVHSNAVGIEPIL